MTLREILASKTQKAERKIIEIAQREVDGKSRASDGDQLADALIAIGKTAADYDDTLALLEKAQSLRSAKEDFEKAETNVAQAQKAITDFERESIEIAERRRGELAGKNGELINLLAESRRTQKLVEELNEIYIQNPDLSPDGPLGLDSYTLIFGENVLPAWAEAPVLYVSKAIWDREYRRRIVVMQKARDKALAEHEAANTSWMRTLIRNWAGNFVSEKPAPVFELPSWRVVVDRGLNA